MSVYDNLKMSLEHSATATDSSSISLILWNECRQLVEETERHPFVEQLFDQTLGKRQFQFYVEQDAFFLVGFARAYCSLAASAPTWPILVELHSLADGVIKERELHKNLAAKWNVSLDNTAAEPATNSYVELIQNSIKEAPAPLMALAALTPCMRLYAHLGELGKKTLTEKRIAVGDYIDWIDEYSSTEFQELATKLESLLDRAYDASLDNGFCMRVYKAAMGCEYEFFNAAFHLYSGINEKTTTDEMR
mmetsp:Transcript_10271/g.18507  ORF Transcript_10271/g.18507 Transcript_10271/m.18507 type:complete len:249 (-) Transcript_10271:605-1351(-)